MALLSKSLVNKLASAKTQNLDLADFEFNEKENYFEHKDGHKLSKLSYCGLAALIDLGVEPTILAPKAGSDWARAWF